MLRPPRTDPKTSSKRLLGKSSALIACSSPLPPQLSKPNLTNLKTDQNSRPKTNKFPIRHHHPSKPHTPYPLISKNPPICALRPLPAFRPRHPPPSIPPPNHTPQTPLYLSAQRTNHTIRSPLRTRFPKHKG